MPLFYFHLENGERSHHNGGQFLPTNEAAIAHAEVVAHELAHNKPEDQIIGFYIVVKDAQGNEIFRAALQR